MFNCKRHLTSLLNVYLTTFSYLSMLNFGVTSKLETDLERMWKEEVMAEFHILSWIFLRTVQVKMKKIIFSGNT
jgi:hypothetical protein